MNESGKQLLLNSIAYISRFTEDRPIAVTPSVFAGPVARSRATLGRWLRIPSYPTDFGKDVVAPEVWKQVSRLPTVRRWRNGPMSMPGSSIRTASRGWRSTKTSRRGTSPSISRNSSRRRSPVCVRTTRPQRPARLACSSDTCRRSQRRLGRSMGCVVEGEPAFRLRVRRRRLPLVHRSSGEETRRARQRVAGAAACGSAVTGSLAQRAITRPAMRPEHGGRSDTKRESAKKADLRNPVSFGEDALHEVRHGGDGPVRIPFSELVSKQPSSLVGVRRPSA